MDEPAKTTYLSLPALERAARFQFLISQGTTASQIARGLGKSLAYVSNTLRLLKLPPIIQEGLISNTISEGHARAILGLKSEDNMVSVYKEIIVSGLSVRQAEELVRKTIAFKPTTF